MAIADVLKTVGTGLEHGLEATGRVAGAVLPTVGRSIANEEAGYAPQIAAEGRAHKEKLEDAALAAKEAELTQQLETGRKYGTLTPDQQGQYVDAITNLYSHPRHAATLMEKLRKAVHPDGMVAGAAPKLASAIPEGGTAQADEANAEKLAAAKYHAKPLSPNSAFYDSYARKQGYADTSEMTPEDWEKAIKEQKTAGRSPVKWSPVHFNGNFYVRNPETNEMKFIGKETNTTVRHGVANVTVGDPPHVIQIPTTTYVSKVSGQPIVDEETGVPYEAQDDTQGSPVGATPTDATPPVPKPTTGAKKPSVGAVLSGAPKTGAKPVSPKPHTTPKPSSVASAMTPPGATNLPRGSRDLGQKGPGLVKKAEVADASKAYSSANATALDLEKTYNLAVARANQPGNKSVADNSLVVAYTKIQNASSAGQGGARMTSAELKMTKDIGSYGLNANTFASKAASGELPGELRKMLITDIKLAADAAKEEAATAKQALEGLAQGESSGTPSSSGNIIVVSPEDLK